MLDPREWDWKHENGRMTPTKTAAKPEPEWLLKDIDVASWIPTRFPQTKVARNNLVAVLTQNRKLLF